MAIMRIRSSAGAYEVHCAHGILASASRQIERLGVATSVFLLSSPRVWEHLGANFRRALPMIPRGHVILFDDAEARKDMPTVEALCRALAQAGADRHSVVVAAGGGVVGDVAGYAAASYLRGVRLVQIPTTLVAQVDSAIGGKTGVNLPEGKNLVGAFYPPKLVLADPELLRTLPHREYRSGLYEVIKYGVIADAELFALLEKQMLACLRRDSATLSRVIERCIRIKARVVIADEREGGLRQILNFGHTVGHALEAVTGYRRFLHGEAVGWGMIAATMIGAAAGNLSEKDAARILRLISRVGPLPALGKVPAAKLRPIMASDKKTRAGKVRWVLPQKIGKTRWGVEVGWPVVARAIHELTAVEYASRA
ncbi:MAG TPA: 3-dehydroquinate synthase [Candidatus Acidoferrum sp.]|nr:3-dehydroquinate synthase [Candidatus Acidoferrum sp.]